MDFAHQGECRWLQGSARASDRDTSNGYASYSERAVSFTGGFQTEIKNGLFGGLGASYEIASLDGSLSSHGNANRFQIGGVIKVEINNWTLGTSLTGGIAFNDLNREIISPGGSVFADSGPDNKFASAALYAAHEFNVGSYFIKPSIGVGAAYLRQDGFSESGAGTYGMNVNSADVSQYWANPAIEFGKDFDRADVVARAFVEVGLLTTSTAGDDLEASFLADPSGENFAVSDDFPDLLADIAIGFDAQIGDNVSIRLGADARVGDGYESYAANAKLRLGF